MAKSDKICYTFVRKCRGEMKTILIIVSGCAALVGGLLWFALRDGRRDVSVEQEGQAVQRRDGKIPAAKTQRPKVVKTDRRAPADAADESLPVDAWVESLPEADRKLGQGIVDNLDNENLEELRKLVQDARRSANPEIRERMVDALGWFGKDAVVELTGFLGDRNADIAQSAFNAWDSAVDQVDDESFKIGAAAAAMQTLTDGDSLQVVAAKLEAADDRKAAIQAIVQVMESGNKAAAEAAKDAYRFIADEEWPGAGAARLKAMTIDREDEQD